MELKFAGELFLQGILLPGGLSLAIFLLGRWLLPPRYGVPVAFSTAWLVGYLWLDWAKVVPERHYQWLPYMPLAAIVPLSVSLADGVRRVERLLLFLPLSLCAAAFVVPTWARLQDVRQWYVLSLAAGLWLLCVAGDELAGRMRPGWFLSLHLLVLGGLSGIMMGFVSVTYGQLLLAAAGALSGIALMSVRTQDVAVSAAVSPHISVVLGCGAFLGFVDPNPPLYGFLIPLALPILLLPVAVVPWARRRPRVMAGFQLSVVVVVFVATVLVLRSEQGVAAADYGY